MDLFIKEIQGNRVKVMQCYPVIYSRQSALKIEFQMIVSFRLYSSTDLLITKLETCAIKVINSYLKHQIFSNRIITSVKRILGPVSFNIFLNNLMAALTKPQCYNFVEYNIISKNVNNTVRPVKTLNSKLQNPESILQLKSAVKLRKVYDCKS